MLQATLFFNYKTEQWKPFSHQMTTQQDLHTSQQQKDDAINISFILIKKGHNLDFGLIQINLVNAKKFHLTLNNLFDPCENIKVGAKILTDNFIKTSRENSNEQIALLKLYLCIILEAPIKDFLMDM